MKTRVVRLIEIEGAEAWVRAMLKFMPDDGQRAVPFLACDGGSINPVDAAGTITVKTLYSSVKGGMP